MKAASVTGIFTAGIRLVSAASKFLLFLYLGKTVEVGTVGQYGIIAASIGLVVQFIGLEFHYFNAREMLSGQGDRRGRFFRDQIVLHCLSYAVLLPCLVLFFVFGTLDWTWAGYFFPLVVLEHLSQEIFRVLVTCFRPVLGTIVLFIRSGLWVFGFVLVSEYGPDAGPLDLLLVTWLAFSGLSVIVGAWGLKSMLTRHQLLAPVDWSWMVRGVRTSAPFFITSVFFTSLQVFDRFVLHYFEGNDAVGVFFFLASLASFLGVVLTFSVGVFHGPKAIFAYQNLGLEQYSQARRLLIKRYFQVGAIITVPAVGAIFPVLHWVGKPEYLAFVHVYWIMLGANAVLTAADVVNFDLYVRGHDKAIMWSALLGSLCALLVQVSLVAVWGVTGAAVATTLSYALLGLIRYRFLQAKLITGNQGKSK